MRRNQGLWLAGMVTLAAVVAVPVWAQSNNDMSGQNSQNGQGGQQSQIGQIDPGGQNGQQQAGGQKSSQNGDRASGQRQGGGQQMGQQMNQDASDGGSAGHGLSGHKQSAKNGPQGHGHPPHPAPPDGPMAMGNPLKHVCLNKSDAYSPGAVVKMNQKPYECKAMSDDTSGTLHWVAVKEE